MLPTPDDSTPLFTRLMTRLARLEHTGTQVTRFGLVVVLVWIGGLKVAPYEADGIVPFVANSPVMNFFYGRPAPEYQAHLNKEGAVVPENRAWHQANHTQEFAWGLGAVIVALGLMIAAYPVSRLVSALGSLLVVGMSVVTLSFLVTTPETWVPDLGGPHHGFPYLSGSGRLVVKDVIMLGAGLFTAAASARAWLAERVDA